MGYLLLFLAGALLCNAIPHLAAGLRGEPFPTPFAKPPGKGLSPPIVNVLWGTVNIALGVAAAFHGWRDADVTLGSLAMLAGWLAIGTYLARHFGRVRAER